MRIGLTGTMSCGKTTLVKALKKLPEFKDYKIATERSKYLKDQGVTLNEDSTIKGQLIFAAERSLELMKENIITDRTVYDVCAFTLSAKSIDWNIKQNFVIIKKTNCLLLHSIRSTALMNFIKKYNLIILL